MKLPLRAHIRLVTNQLSSDQRLNASTVLTRCLLSYVDAHLSELATTGVAIFKSMVDEIDLAAFESELVKREIPIWFPSKLGSLELGPRVKPKDDNRGPGLIIVPGIAFDRRGNRLGRGKGYYDRLLRALKSGSKRPKTIGVGFDHQLVDVVPIEPHDERVDMLCMPSHGLIECDHG